MKNSQQRLEIYEQVDKALKDTTIPKGEIEKESFLFISTDPGPEDMINIKAVMCGSRESYIQGFLHIISQQNGPEDLKDAILIVAANILATKGPEGYVLGAELMEFCEQELGFQCMCKDCKANRAAKLKDINLN